jgi:hypothetical protein
MQHCSPYISRQLIQFNSEIDIDTDDEGDVTFIVKATYQAIDPITDNTGMLAFADNLIQNTAKSFQGMRRHKRLSYSRDKRIAHITVEYKEIKSDNAFFEDTRNIEATDEISSELLGSKGYTNGTGFYTWNRRISVSITLPPRIHKTWGYVVFKKILEERFRRLRALNKTAALFGNAAPANQAADANAAKNWYLCTKIKITESIYSRTIKFDYEYLVCTDLLTIFRKTLIGTRVNTKFTPEHVPKTISEQWKAWDTNSDKNLNGWFEYEDTGPIIYSQCNTSSEDPPEPTKFGSNVLGSLENDPDYEDITKPTPTHSHNEPLAEGSENSIPPEFAWLHYENEFEVIQTNNNVQISYLQNTDPNYYKNVSSSGPLRSSTGYQIDNITNDPDSSTLKPETIVRGDSSFKLRMSGMAIRVGYTIPIPIVMSVGNSSVSRTGTSRTKQIQISTGDLPVYLALWDITYNVDKDMHTDNIDTTIKTTGNPGYYT